ncbi:SAM-dependent methyltransferase [Nocardia sp. NPDC051052]|uniref:SAM-dependent methyltransferase n=1 Tax=Nocardia sp. NPDC051052 TaxID=3364322 RepID=UPI0037A6858F
MPSSILDAANVPNVDLYILGYGLTVPGDLTLSTVAALRHSRRVFMLPKVLIDDFVNEPPVDLARHYGIGDLRQDSYRIMADEVLAAVDEEPPVAFITYGHPFVGCRVGHILFREAVSRSIKMYVGNAPSSIETVCSELGIEPFSGLQIWGSDQYLRRKPQLDRSGWLFLMQVPYVGTVTATHLMAETRYDESSVLELKSLLTAQYPSDHIAYFVRASMVGLPTSIRRFYLKDMVEAIPQNGATMVIPPIESYC